MKKRAAFSFLLALGLSSQAWSAAWDQQIPMATGEEQADAFLRIQNLIPSLGDGAVRYNMNPSTLFNAQITIGTMMTGSDSYKSLLQEHRQLLQFTVFDASASQADSSDKETAWLTYKQRSLEYAKTSGLQNSKALENEIARIAASPLTGKSQGIVVGLAQLLPNEIKKSFFAMSLNDKVQILERHLPEEVVAKGFDPKRIGWADTAITKDEIVARLKAAAQNEAALTSLVAAHYASLEKVLATPKDYLKSWNGNKVVEQLFSSSLVKMIPQTTNSAPVVNLVIREVPPVVGLFRGFAGNDCSTKFSYPFVNSPNEYTFLIYNSKGQLKGYAQGTKVIADGRNAFYLHTVAGPRVSVQDALDVIAVLHQEKAHLNVSEIVLPTKERMDKMVNFLPVRDAMTKVSATNSRVLQYQDEEIRLSFKEKFKIAKEYDDAKTNTDALAVDVAKLRPLSVRVNEADGLEKVSTEIERDKLFRILLQLGKNNGDLKVNEQMIKVLAPRIGLDPYDIKDLATRSENKNNLPVAMFFNDFEHRLERSGFALPKNQSDQVALLAMGILNAEDALEDRKLLYQVIDALLEQRVILPVGDFLEKNPSLYRDDRILKAFMEAFYNDFQEADQRPQTQLEKALSTNTKGVLENRSLLATILRSKKGTQTLIEFVDKRPKLTIRLQNTPEGRQLLSLREEGGLKIQQIAAKLRSSTNESDFVRWLALEFPGRSYKERAVLERKVVSQALDHYLKLSNRETIEKILFLFTNSSSGEDYERELRRLIPAAMQVSSMMNLNLFISQLIENKAVSRKPERFTKAILEGLKTRAASDPDFDISKLTSLKRLPELDWDGKRVLRCENIF